MPVSVEDGASTLPPPPDMPDGVAPTAPDIMPASMTPTTPASEAPRWLFEVALPFALGVVCAVSWAGALILAAWDGLPFGELRAAQVALLLVVPTLVVVVAVAPNRSFWRATQRGQLSGALRLLLTLAVIIIGLAPAFFATTPLPPNNNIGLLFFLPFAAPGFSLGVALGFTWGAHIRPVFSGVVVGWLGGLGFAAPLAVLGVIGIVMAQQQTNQCHTAGYECMIGAEFAQAANIVLIISPLIIGLVGIVGAVFGAFLSGE